MLEKIIKAVELEYIFNKIIHCSSDCDNFLVNEYISILEKNDNLSRIYYHFCTEIARWRHHAWTRIIPLNRKEDLKTIYCNIVIVDEKNYKDENNYCNWERNTSVKIDGKDMNISENLLDIVDYIHEKYDIEFEQKYKQVREEIELEKINKEFE